MLEGNDVSSCYLRMVDELAVGLDEAKGEAFSDDALLSMVADGDRGAFALLMKRYLARMVALAQRIVLDREQAREIAQEAFLRVWQNAWKWDPDGKATFSTWLSRIVINQAISCRRRHREREGLDIIEELPSGDADGFDLLAASEEKKAVAAALLELPDRQRAAVSLFYFEDYSQTQAAAAMDMTPRAFDSLIVRARANLKKSLSKLGLGRCEEFLKRGKAS